MTKILNYKLTFKYVALLVFITILTTYSFVTYFTQNNQASLPDSTACGTVNIKRLEGYKYVKPLLFVDKEEESVDFTSMKSEMTNLIDAFVKQNKIKSASVYIKDYNSNDWIAINPDEQYKPGSLLKIPELIAFLKMNETKPGLLEKKYTFNKNYSTDKKAVFTSKSIQFGKSYTVRELLKYMIVYSDNNATYMLNEIIDVAVFKKVFTDLGMKEPDWNATDYFITSKEVSLFMRALFNASYLSIADSEFATSLLSQSDFNKGITAALPKNVKYCHKFGESGDALEKQLNETAIIYGKDRTYLITVMTKGSTLNELPEVLKEISAVAYRNLIGADPKTI